MRFVPGLLLIALLSAPDATAGAPLKGVDVKLGRNPGNTALRTVTTDADGKFDFGVLPAGSYTITLAAARPRNAGNAGNAGNARSASPAAAPDVVTVSIAGAARGPVTYTYDRTANAIVPDPPPANAKAKEDKGKKGSKDERMTFDSDGVHPVNGTVVKSKSNIANN